MVDLPQAVAAFEWLEQAVGGSWRAYPAIVAAVGLDSTRCSP